MNRFFIEKSAIENNIAHITGEDAGHIVRVLRLRPGAHIILCDGACAEYCARIIEITKNEVLAEIVAKSASTTEPACAITLYQSLPKTGKMETIIQKCVELGVHGVVPVQSERCVVRPGDFSAKLERYRRVAYEAAKQSRRGIVPAVHPLQPLQACTFQAYDTVLLAYEQEQAQTLKSALRGEKPESAALIIGPEGGFEEKEVEALVEKGARSVSLGTRILRTETAGMAMLAMALYEWEG